MKKFLFYILSYLVIFSATSQVKIQTETTPQQAEKFIKSVPLKEFENYVKLNGMPYVGGSNTLDEPGLTAVTSQTEYRWSFKNNNFFSYVKAFRTDLTPPPICVDSSSGKLEMWKIGCRQAIYQLLQCHLFIVSPLRKLVAVQPLNIPQPNFIEAKPACFDVYAMAPAKVVEDGMLIIVGYYDSRWTCNSGWYCASDSPAASPDPLYKTTFLVRFSEDEKGRLVLSQDDKCMPPLNSYNTIAEARDALKKNGCR
ncbi:hypothetical protein ACSFA3_13225 [Variovorax sp. RHLX14]|uniref:hypothetical protein n=1 Tax=Variovorax sp. RHLX14 TaxID=1259731 RepID=UPI003F44E6EC